MLEKIKSAFKSSKGAGAMEGISSMAIAVAGLAISLTVTFLILGTGKKQAASIEGHDYTNDSSCELGSACNATMKLTNAVATIPSWIPLVILAMIGSVLLGLVALFRRRG